MAVPSVAATVWARARLPLEIAGVVVGILFAYQWYLSIGRTAVAQADERAARTSLDSVAKLAPKAETTYVHDTVTLHTRETVYRQVRDTLLLNVHDTVQVVRFVRAADSTIAACQAVVQSCDIRHSVDSSRASLWQRMYNDERHLRPSLVQVWGPRIVAALAGFGAGRLAK